MSWYSFSFGPVKRSEGRSAVAACAYICGESMKDLTTGELHDYSRKQGVISVKTYAREGIEVPQWARDPANQANAMEGRETRSNSQVAFGLRFSLPAVVSEEARQEIGDRFAQGVCNRYGLLATAAWHAPGPEGDDRNWHIHILFSTRELEPDGLGAKCRAFSKAPGAANPDMTDIRKLAADLINEALEDAGSDERVSHLSFEARGIERVPTEHLGPTASAMERKGKATKRGDRNRAIASANRRIAENDRIVAELEALNAQIMAREEARLDEQYGKLERAESEAAHIEPLEYFTRPDEALFASIQSAMPARFGPEQPPRTEDRFLESEVSIAAAARQDDFPACIRPDEQGPRFRFTDADTWRPYAERMESAARFLRETAAAGENETADQEPMDTFSPDPGPSELAAPSGPELQSLTEDAFLDMVESIPVAAMQEELPPCIQPNQEGPHIRLFGSAWRPFAERMKGATRFLRDTAAAFAERAREKAGAWRDDHSHARSWRERVWPVKRGMDPERDPRDGRPWVEKEQANREARKREPGDRMPE
jgi:cell division septum initiation protein DivIVA